MAKKVEKRARFLSKFAANTELISQVKASGKSITRDTFKRYVENSQLTDIEKNLGYDSKNGYAMAKDNKMIEYWKCKFPEVDQDTFIYKPSPNELYVFV